MSQSLVLIVKMLDSIDQRVCLTILIGMVLCNDALIVEDGRGVKTMFDHTPADYGPMYDVLSVGLVIADPIDQCIPTNTTYFNASAVLFRANCCHGAEVPTGDCFYDQRTAIAQLNGGVMAIIVNCDSIGEGYNDPLVMGPAPWPVLNVSQFTIPSISVGCDTLGAIYKMQPPINITLNKDGESWYWIDDQIPGAGPKIPWWIFFIWGSTGIVLIYVVGAWIKEILHNRALERRRTFPWPQFHHLLPP